VPCTPRRNACRRREHAIADAPPNLEVYQLHISLIEISPTIWRRLLVRSKTTIADLHYVLQIAFGWTDCHLHRFVIDGKAYGVAQPGGICFADDPQQIRLCDLGLRSNSPFRYEYDFGELWQQHPRLERILPVDSRRSDPFWSGGAGQTPGCRLCRSAAMVPTLWCAPLLQRPAHGSAASLFGKLTVPSPRLATYIPQSAGRTSVGLVPHHQAPDRATATPQGAEHSCVRPAPRSGRRRSGSHQMAALARQCLPLYRTLAHPLCKILGSTLLIGSAILAENGPCLETISRLRSSGDRNHGVGSTIIWDTRHRNGWACLVRTGALAGGGG